MSPEKLHVKTALLRTDVKTSAVGFLCLAGDITKFTTEEQVTIKMNWLDFEAERSEVKVTMKPNMVKNHSFKMQLSGEGILVHSLPSETFQFKISFGITVYIFNHRRSQGEGCRCPPGRQKIFSKQFPWEGDEFGDVHIPG